MSFVKLVVGLVLASSPEMMARGLQLGANNNTGTVRPTSKSPTSKERAKYNVDDAISVLKECVGNEKIQEWYKENLQPFGPKGMNVWLSLANGGNPIPADVDAFLNGKCPARIQNENRKGNPVLSQARTALQNRCRQTMPEREAEVAANNKTKQRRLVGIMVVIISMIAYYAQRFFSRFTQDTVEGTGENL